MINPFDATPGSRRGFALVTVLAFLALLVAITIGFLSRATTERSAASGALSASSARQLADTAVSLVQGQINIATAQGASVAWTSQPGLIRTFDTNGSLLKAYKLYSSDQMIASTIDLAADLSTDWYRQPAIWTDLNAPVADVSGTKNYPILDGSSSSDGFELKNAPAATGENANPVPMPVKWIYVLKDGSLVAPALSGTTVQISGEAYNGTPNDANGNPVVGRIAFWADDETCKVNINTAAEGTYWDTPHAYTIQEVALGNYQPALREFQAYPGHPAMTSLSPVFTTFTKDQIYNIAPRVVGGGSEGGTKIAPGAIASGTDRLYSSVDELLFAPSRDLNGGMDKAQLERAKFFLTAHSRAPEVNLFNLPRIACWPMYEGLADGYVTPFDRLVAFCSTVNGSAYYFQRKDPKSSTHDIDIDRNKELYDYLQYLTNKDIPGYGGRFYTKYSVDRDQILTEIFDYIRSANLYDDNLAKGKQFTNGLSKNSPPIRDNAPLQGHGYVAPSIGPNNTLGFGRAMTLSELAIGFICNAAANDPATTDKDESCGSNETEGAAANAVLGGTKLTVGQKYIQAVLVPEFFSAMQGYRVLSPEMSVQISGLDTLSVTVDGSEKKLFPAGMTEATATYKMDPNMISYARDIGGVCDWRYAFGNDMTSVESAANAATAICATSQERINGASGAPGRGHFPGDAGTTYPFIGEPVIIKAGQTMRFNEAHLTVRIYAGVSGPTLVQTFSIIMPEGDFPQPVIAPDKLPILYSWDTKQERAEKETWWGFSKRGSVKDKPGRLLYAFAYPGWYMVPKWGQFFRADCDVVRTVLPSHGDYRLIAATPAVPTNVFVPHRYYFKADESHRMASNLGGDGSSLFWGYDLGGKYISAFSYGDSQAPDINAAAAKAQLPENTGDYDTGVGCYMDGPYVNKPDEGDFNRANGIPYFAAPWISVLGGATYFTPNRQMPSPGMFGSLPTGVKHDTPWQTLLFRPQSGHPGADSPKDSLLLDLFWMPVVQPYAISDRFSTDGKINLNYQIAPFTYIERSTGMRALLKSEKVAAISDKTSSGSYNSGIYKKYNYAACTNSDTYRLPVNVTETLKQFQDKFDRKEVFKSASDICDLWMVPEGETVSSMTSFWQNHRLTGDNLREKIYTTLYPRLTAKSNTFTVHFRVQALRKAPSSAAGTWTEGKDIVTGEYRGSTVIERFIDSNNTQIPDYAENPAKIGQTDTPTLDSFYRWRVLSNRQFAP